MKNVLSNTAISLSYELATILLGAVKSSTSWIANGASNAIEHGKDFIIKKCQNKPKKFMAANNEITCHGADIQSITLQC